MCGTMKVGFVFIRRVYMVLRKHYFVIIFMIFFLIRSITFESYILQDVSGCNRY